MAMTNTRTMPGVTKARAAAIAALAVLTMGGLGACSSAPPLFTNDGRPTQQITCNSGGWAECQRRATVACGDGGYDTLNQSSGDQNTMVIACKQIKRSY